MLRNIILNVLLSLSFVDKDEMNLNPFIGRDSQGRPWTTNVLHIPVFTPGLGTYTPEPGLQLRTSTSVSSQCCHTERGFLVVFLAGAFLCVHVLPKRRHVR